jgi:hypothetical protein
MLVFYGTKDVFSIQRWISEAKSVGIRESMLENPAKLILWFLLCFAC